MTVKFNTFRVELHLYHHHYLASLCILPSVPGSLLCIFVKISLQPTEILLSHLKISHIPFPLLECTVQAAADQTDHPLLQCLLALSLVSLLNLS